MSGHLNDREARILRVQLDRELKREYKRFLQERNRGDRDSDGRPDRTVEEIQHGALKCGPRRWRTKFHTDLRTEDRTR